MRMPAKEKRLRSPRPDSAVERVPESREKRGKPVVFRRRAPQRNPRRRPTLPQGLPSSTIGAGGLNDRVRNGNGCDPSAIATENDSHVRQSNAIGVRRLLPEGNDLFLKDQAARPISTSRLNGLHRLHLWPINLVVYEEPSGTEVRDILSWGGLRA